VLAECGGLIYLSQGIVYDSSPTTFGIYPLAGIFNVYISMRKVDRKLSLGYRQLEYKGQTLRGHEFHYTQYMKQEWGDLLMPPSVAKVYDARGKLTPTPVFRYKNVIASYTHLYWGEVDIEKLF
jgi:cobyrinic acid a,c-diamide synthase